MNTKRIIIFIAAIALVIIGIFSLSSNLMTPYVDFPESINHPDKYVQIIGKLDKKIPVKYSDTNFIFTLISKKGNKITVSHNGAKPLNFEHAEQVVALGKFDAVKKIFIADKILVKCPSKYKKQINFKN